MVKRVWKLCVKLPDVIFVPMYEYKRAVHRMTSQLLTWLVMCLVGVAIVKWWWMCYKQQQQEARKSRAQKAIDKVENLLTEGKKPIDEMLSVVDTFKLAETYHYGRHGREVNLRRAAELYAEAGLRGMGEAWMGLGLLWKNSGVEGARDPMQAYTAFSKAAVEFGIEDAWLEIGDLYMFGMHPTLLPDKMSAARFYQDMKASATVSQAGRGIAQRKLKDIWETGYGDDPDAIPRPEQEYVFLPRWDHGSQSVQVQVPTTRALPPVRVSEQLQRAELRTATIDVDAELAAALGRLQDVDIQHIRSDSQNVHDSMVQRAVHKRLQDLAPIQTDAVHEFKRAMRELTQSGNLSRADHDAATRLIGSLTEAVHSRYNESEQAIFNKVWARIQDPQNADRRQDMITVLAQQMASGIEHDAPVCSTGKIVRMMGALDGMDKASETVPTLKPEWAIREEISAKATQVRKSFEDLGDSENAEGMRAALRDAVSKDYVSSGILKTHEVEGMLAPYLEAF